MKQYLVVAALATAIPGLAVAQSTMSDLSVGAEEGDREFTISGTGSSDKNFDGGSAGIAAQLGWYLSDEMVVGVRQSVNYADIEGEDASNDFWNGSTRGYVDYHFLDDAFRPFVGASLGGIYGDGVKDSAFAGPELGLKYYVRPKTYITGTAEYQFFFDDANDAEDSFDDGAWAYGIGVGYNF